MNNEIELRKDVRKLRKKVSKLKRCKAKNIEKAICDIIDIGGYSLAVLLEKIDSLPVDVQLKAARKIEDFLYFHPENGKKVFNRLKQALKKCSKDCVPHLLSAAVDTSRELPFNEMSIDELATYAEYVLKSDVDYMRASRAVEVLLKSKNQHNAPLIIRKMIGSLENVDDIAGYHFVETSLLALKKLGGELLLRVLVNPDSSAAAKELRVSHNHMDSQIFDKCIGEVKKAQSDFAQILLKIIDLSEFNLPFITMIKEGLEHHDKWVRQAAAASMEKASSALNPDKIGQMLNDPAPEVRLMAVSSLGGYSIEQTGEALVRLAQQDGETDELRLNAVFSLFSQKNMAGLKTVANSDNPKVAIHSKGLLALLQPCDESLESMLNDFCCVSEKLLNDITHYLMEMTEPEDLPKIVQFNNAIKKSTHRERFLKLISSFISNKAGPRLDKAKQKLADSDMKAIELIIPA